MKFKLNFCVVRLDPNGVLLTQSMQQEPLKACQGNAHYVLIMHLTSFFRKCNLIASLEEVIYCDIYAQNAI